MRCAPAICLLMIATPVLAWGPEGHRVIADVARHRLNPATKQAIIRLLGSDDLASISSWADRIRRTRPETFGWHFVDIPWSASGFSQARDCYRPPAGRAMGREDHHNCVVDRIEIFSRVLADKTASSSDRVEALKFVIHFVADVHQPLHAIGEARGGNDVRVVQFGSAICRSRLCELHGAWDVGLIEHAHRSEADYAAHLEEMVSRQKLEARAEGTPALWANESFELAHRIWLGDGAAVDESYYRQNLDVLDEQLALAALRLAALLNADLSQ
jgi:hypothetical protein